MSVKTKKIITAVLLVAVLAACVIALLKPDSRLAQLLFGGDDTPSDGAVVIGERYTSPEQVAEYIHTFNELPPNFITKSEAQKLGWVANKGNLWDVTDKMSIGGDSFGNREGLLPVEKGRKYYECDVNYSGGFRGSERLIYSNDGLIYYTDDHYESFTQLYGG